LARRYRRFADAFASIETALASREAVTPEAAFIIRTLLIHEYRKIHLQDPLLPPALLPADWVGSIAYDSCARLYGKVFPAAAVDQRTWRLSTTRCALPTERSRDPGLHTEIRVVTPIRSLMLY
jgi:DNA-binding transcriptional regulator PaaX